MPLFGLIPKKNKSTPALQQQAATQPGASSSSSSAPLSPPNSRHAHRTSVSSVPNLRDLDQPLVTFDNDQHPSRFGQRPRAGTASSSLGPTVDSASSVSSSPPRIRANGVNTSPPIRTHRNGGGRPSLDKVETFGIRRITNTNNGSNANPNRPSSSSVSNTNPNLDPSTNGSRTYFTSSDADTSFASSTYDDDTRRSSVSPEPGLQPPSRSAIFGSGYSDPRSQLSTQSLPDGTLPGARGRGLGSGSSATGSGNEKVQRPILATRQPASRKMTNESEDRERERWGGSQMSHHTTS